MRRSVFAELRRVGAHGTLRRSRVVLAAVTALAALALTACDAIPSSGPVREGLTSLEQGERGVQFSPPGPRAGADQEEIVRGFVRAANSSVNDYEVAREYLAPVYAEQWDPSIGVLIDEGTHQMKVEQGNIAMLSLNLVANVDQAGTLTLAEPDRTTEVQFELVQVGGEWRISSAPAGIILDRNTFTAVWSPRALYYVSGDNRLVADIRWFLSRSQALSTQIVRELLRGPSDQMNGALRTSFPEGTALSVESVPVIDGVAAIDLTAEVLEIDDANMQLLKRQISYSLPSTLTGYELSVHGTIIETGTIAVADDSASGERQFIALMQGGKFGTISAGELKPIAGLSERIDELSGVRAVTLSPDRTAAAVQFAGGVAWVKDEQIVVVDPRTDLLVPSLDGLGYIWTYDPQRPGSIDISRSDGYDETLSIGWLESRKTVAVRVSTGGNHIAALIEDDGGSAVHVAGIVRDEAGRPVGLTEQVTTQLWMPGKPLDLDWIGDTRFATLTESGLLGSSSRVTIGIVGNFATDAGAVASGESVSGGSRALLRVLDDEQRLFAPQGLTAWQQYQSGIELVAKVG